MSGEALLPLDAVLADLIREHGGDYPVANVRGEMATTLREIRADNAAHGEPECPFFSFSIARGVAVFTLYSEGLEIYVVRCDPIEERELIGRFEPLAMVDVAESLEVLRSVYGKAKPDLSINPVLAHDWLFGDQPSGVAGGQQ